MSNLTRIIGAVKLASKAHAPTIMVVSGVAAMGASVITASRRTMHLEEVLTPHVQKLEEIQAVAAASEQNDNWIYTKENQTKDKGRILLHAGTDLTKLYAVPTILFVGGTALIFGGHRMMLQRNATLAIAFTGLKESFDAYRQRVREEFGENVDQGMLNGWKTIEVVDDEGNIKTVNTRDWDAAASDPYNRIFGQGETSQWHNDLGVNKLFIQNVQRMCQITLGRRGYLYLCEVYEALGFPETDVSRVVGWKETRNPDGTKDIPVIDFGLDTPMPDDWKYTKENAIYLDFNCQGLIIGGKIQKALENA